MDHAQHAPIYYRVRMILLVIAIAFAIVGFVHTLHGETNNTREKFNKVDDRLDSSVILTERNAVALGYLQDRIKIMETENLEQRLVKLETSSSELNFYLRTIFGSIVALVAGVGADLFKRHRDGIVAV